MEQSKINFVLIYLHLVVPNIFTENLYVLIPLVSLLHSFEATTLTGVNILDKILDTNVTVPLVLNSPGGPLTSLDPIFRRSRISFNDEFTATY
ncbi:hypothetical protein ANTQUA_LOCUS5712 [Anthophora quadrimaculata]